MFTYKIVGWHLMKTFWRMSYTTAHPPASERTNANKKKERTSECHMMDDVNIFFSSERWNWKSFLSSFDLFYHSDFVPSIATASKLMKQNLHSKRIHFCKSQIMDAYFSRFLSSPLLNKAGRVVGFAGQNAPHRRFPIDMAGFAFTVKMLYERRPKMPYRATHEEDMFIRSMRVRWASIFSLTSIWCEFLHQSAIT